MKRKAANKKAIRQASISFNVIKARPKSPTSAATGLDTEIVNSIRSAWRPIEAEFNNRPNESVDIEDLLRKGLGGNLVAGRYREYLAALHSELLSRKKFQLVAVEANSGNGERWRLRSQVPTLPPAGAPAADYRYVEVSLTAPASQDLDYLREKARENDSARLAGGYVCALNYNRLMTGVLPIRQRDRSLFPSKPDPSEIILHPDRTLSEQEYMSAWIDRNARCIFGLAALFQALPITVSSRFQLTRLGKETRYSLSIELDSEDVRRASVDQITDEPRRKRTTTSFREIACVLAEAGTSLPFRRLHRLVNRRHPMPPETLAAVLSDWQCLAPSGATGSEIRWRFDPSELRSGRRSVRAARLSRQNTLSDLAGRSETLSTAIDLIFKKTQLHREQLADISRAGTQTHPGSKWDGQR